MLTAQGNWINIDLTGEKAVIYLFCYWIIPPVAVASGSVADKDKYPLELWWWHFT